MKNETKKSISYGAWFSILMGSGVFWCVWAAYGFWWGLLYGFFWEVWLGYWLARLLLS